MTAPGFLFLYITIPCAILVRVLITCIVARFHSGAAEDANDDEAGNSHGDIASHVRSKKIATKSNEDSIQKEYLQEHLHCHSKILEEHDIISRNSEVKKMKERISDCNTSPVMLNAASEVYAKVHKCCEKEPPETTVNKDLVDPKNNEGASIHSSSQPDRIIDMYGRDRDCYSEEIPTRNDIDEVDLEAGLDNTVECCHPNECCYICFGDFEVGECIAWSSNKACTHRFHLNCILEWLHRSSTRKLAKLLRDKHEQNSSVSVNTTSSSDERENKEEEEQQQQMILMSCIKAVPYLCPLCRQDFVSHPS